MNKPTRRVRGNGTPPPDDDLPIQYWHSDNEEPEPDDNEELKDFLLALAVIIGSIVVVLYAAGRWI
jgi:hypothetical protein